MKFLHNYNLILESVTYAKAVLRKKDLDANNPDYLKICDITNKDGFTGVLTKLHFIQNVDLNEIEDLYKTLKAKKIDASKLLKMSYDNILDLVYDDDFKDEEKDIILAFKYEDYSVFRVKTYEAGLSINSPAWCLKTKTHYDNYTTAMGGTNFVAILDRFYKRGSLLLPTPDNYKGSSYNNLYDPMVRIGLTIFKNRDFQYFDDSNITNLHSKYRNPIKGISEKCFVWLKNNEPDSLTFEKTQNYEDFECIIQELISDYTTGSFDMGVFTIDQSDIDEILNRKIGNQTIKELFKEHEDSIMKNLYNYCGIMDILIYECFGKDSHPLSGMLLSERENLDRFIRYSYGVHKYVWGRKYILQSYKSIKEYLKFIVDNLHYFFIEDMDDDNLVLIDTELNEYFLNLHDFYLHQFDRMYTIHENPKGYQVIFNLVTKDADVRKFSDKIISYFKKLLGNENVDLDGNKLSLFFDEYSGK